MAGEIGKELRKIPGVDSLAETVRSVASSSGAHIRSHVSPHILTGVPRPVLVQAVRQVLEEVRGDILKGGSCPPEQELIGRVLDRLSEANRPDIRRVLNATGVVLHTNLGRAPLSRRAVEAVAQVASGYSNLEYDLVQGIRGSRHDHTARLLREVLGVQDSIVVNNNAAAVLLCLSAIARDREVIVSRGELVEIGGSFRIPDVIVQSGCVLREVGTTNRTHLQDYEMAINENTAVILKVHTSNYQITGFTSQVETPELARLARERNLVLIYDLGSGALLPTEDFGLKHEPLPVEYIKAGADLVTFSGDKLLGGPQAGIIAGRSDLIAQCKKHPLARALRVDKMTIAALTATLIAYRNGTACAELPIYRYLSITPEELHRRAGTVVKMIEGEAARLSWKVRISPEMSLVGGGSLPGQGLETRAIRLSHPKRPAQDLADELRRNDPPVIVRIEEESVVIDLRTVEPEDDATLAQGVLNALKTCGI